VTVLEVIQRSTKFLAKRGVESPRLQAELLLAHLLALPRMKLYLNFERALSTTETDSMRDLVKRRGTREPLQHIIGSVSFCGLELAVNRSVLIPRPETELLAEAGWEFLAAAGEAASALDLGTGSGCLAIALAAKCPAARVVATDISPEALAVARANAARHSVAERIDFREGDGFAVVPAEARFDLIVSNPPYIATAEIATLEAEVRDHDPRLALDGGADGLDFYRRIATEARAFLKPGGKLMLEFGDGQARALTSLFTAVGAPAYGLADAERCDGLAGPEAGAPGASGAVMTGGKWIVEAVKDDYSQRARILVARVR
jgi:release factor glutamine methyltransferase